MIRALLRVGQPISVAIPPSPYVRHSDAGTAVCWNCGHRYIAIRTTVCSYCGFGELPRIDGQRRRRVA